MDEQQNGYQFIRLGMQRIAIFWGHLSGFGQKLKPIPAFICLFEDVTHF